MTTAEHITPDLEQALAGAGLVIEDVTVTPAGKRRIVKVLLDRELGDVESATERIEPLSLDEVADAARLVGEALDRSDALGEQPYTLEVSSPGVGRPLTPPAATSAGSSRPATTASTSPAGSPLRTRPR